MKFLFKKKSKRKIIHIDVRYVRNLISQYLTTSVYCTTNRYPIDFTLREVQAVGTNDNIINKEDFYDSIIMHGIYRKLESKYKLDKSTIMSLLLFEREAVTEYALKLKVSHITLVTLVIDIRNIYIETGVLSFESIDKLIDSNTL